MPLSGLLVTVGHLEQQGVGEGTPGQLRSPDILDMASSLLDGSGA